MDSENTYSKSSFLISNPPFDHSWELETYPGTRDMSPGPRIISKEKH